MAARDWIEQSYRGSKPRALTIMLSGNIAFLNNIWYTLRDSNPEFPYTGPPDALTIELRVHASVSNSTASTYSQTSSGIIVCIEAGLEPARVAYDASQAIARPAFANFTIPWYTFFDGGSGPVLFRPFQGGDPCLLVCYKTSKLKAKDFWSRWELNPVLFNASVHH